MGGEGVKADLAVGRREHIFWRVRRFLRYSWECGRSECTLWGGEESRKKGGSKSLISGYDLHYVWCLLKDMRKKWHSFSLPYLLLPSCAALNETPLHVWTSLLCSWAPGGQEAGLLRFVFLELAECLLWSWSSMSVFGMKQNLSIMPMGQNGLILPAHALPPSESSWTPHGRANQFFN